MRVSIDSTKLDLLANVISDKSGEAIPMTISEMVEAVDNIRVGSNGIIFVTDEIDENDRLIRHYTTDPSNITTSVDSHGGTVYSLTGAEVRVQEREVTPTDAQQIILPDSDHDALSKVVVDAVPTPPPCRPVYVNFLSSVSGTTFIPEFVYIEENADYPTNDSRRYTVHCEVNDSGPPFGLKMDMFNFFVGEGPTSGSVSSLPFILNGHYRLAISHTDLQTWSSYSGGIETEVRWGVLCLSGFSYPFHFITDDFNLVR